MDYNFARTVFLKFYSYTNCQINIFPFPVCKIFIILNNKLVRKISVSRRLAFKYDIDTGYAERGIIVQFTLLNNRNE